MSTVLDAWIEYDRLVLSYLSKKEQITERGRWKKYLSREFATFELKAIKTLHVLQFRRHLEDNLLSPQSVYHYLSLLRRILRKAQMLELYEGKLPIFDMPKFDNQRQRFLSHEKTELLLFHIKSMSTLWYNICLFALHTGLRASEIFNLKRSYIVFDSKIIAVLDSKNNIARHSPMNQITENILSTYLPSKPEDLFFTDSTGNPIHRVSKIFGRALKKSGLNDGITDRRSKVVFHTLRHTFASWLVQMPGGTPLQLVGDLLGHKTLDMTQRYAHLAAEQRFNAVQNLAKLFNSCKSISAR